MRILKCYWFIWLFVVTTCAGLGLGAKVTFKAAALKRDGNGKSQVYAALPPDDLVASVVKWIELGEKEVLVSARTIGSEKILTALVRASNKVTVRLLLDPDANRPGKGVIAWLKSAKFKGEIRWATAGLYEQRVLVDGKLGLGGAQPWSPKYASSDATSAISGAGEVNKWTQAFEKAWSNATKVPSQ